eukprot:XP_022266362.1 glycosyltransferase 1 domain-containing protein 1 isoform X4 [Canis lupus familiaris]
MRSPLLWPPRKGTQHLVDPKGATCREHLEAAGHICLLKDTSDLESSSEIAHFIKAEKLEAALALHLYRGGRLLQGHGIPFGIIFGGTDLNEDINQREKNQVMGKVLEEARFAVAFTESMKEMAQMQWPHARDKIYVQSQGIVTVPNAAFNWNTFLHCSGINQSADNLHIFLLVCGLRQVKDPLYLVDAFSEWHQEEPNVYMVIVGPEVDPVFTREVKAKVKRTPGVRLLREMPQEDLHAALKNCFAVLNSSVSEGMSAAILEHATATGGEHLNSALNDEKSHPQQDLWEENLLKGTTAVLVERPEPHIFPVHGCCCSA